MKEIHKKGFAFKEFDQQNLCIRLIPGAPSAIQLNCEFCDHFIKSIVLILKTFVDFESTRLISEQGQKSSIVEGNGLSNAAYNNVLALATILRDFLQEKEVAMDSEEDVIDTEKEEKVQNNDNEINRFPYFQ